MLPKKIKERFRKNFYEKISWEKGELLIGIDEAGRGCSAGPVVAAAVVLYPKKLSSLIKDSKKLNSDEIKEAYKWIIRHSWNSVGIIKHRKIDSVNIYQATILAMKRAAIQLLAIIPNRPKRIVVDAMPLKIENFEGESIYFEKGENKSSSIAAASIVAKMVRDSLMKNLCKSFPPYKFSRHKGYCTRCHQEMISLNGISFIHRKSFIHIKKDYDEQKKIFR